MRGTTRRTKAQLLCKPFLPFWGGAYFLAEGKNIFDFINNLMAKNTKRISSMASFLFGMPFLNLNLRKIDQEVNYGRVKFK